jgi:hypothetical protein
MTNAENKIDRINGLNSIILQPKTKLTINFANRGMESDTFHQTKTFFFSFQVKRNMQNFIEVSSDYARNPVFLNFPPVNPKENYFSKSLFTLSTTDSALPQISLGVFDFTKEMTDVVYIQYTYDHKFDRNESVKIGINFQSWYKTKAGGGSIDDHQGGVKTKITFIRNYIYDQVFTHSGMIRFRNEQFIIKNELPLGGDN